MGFLSDLEQKAERFVGGGTRRSEFEGGDVGKTITGTIGLFTGTEELSIASVFADAAKQTANAATQSLYTTVRKHVRNEAKRKKQTSSSLLKKGARFITKAPSKTYKSIVNSKRPTKENTAFSPKNRAKSKIPLNSTKLYESRYSEVYRDSEGKIHAWGKPTISPKPKNVLLHPYSTAREWVENRLRWISPKYKKRDPLYRDMAKIHDMYGDVDHISGYSRGGAMANLQPYSDKTQYDIDGAYTPWNEPDRRIPIHTSKKDYVHRYARFVSKHPVISRIPYF